MAYQMGKYRVWDPLEGDEDDAHEYTCLDHEYAAEEFAEYQCGRDSDYYESYAGGIDLQVRLIDEPDQPAFTVHVSMETVPEFHASMQRVKLEVKS